MRYALFTLAILLATPAYADYYPAMHREGELYCSSQDTAWQLGYELTNRRTSATERERAARARGCSVLEEDARVLSARVIAPDGGMPFVLFEARLIPDGIAPEDAVRDAEAFPRAYFLFLPPP